MRDLLACLVGLLGTAASMMQPLFAQDGLRLDSDSPSLFNPDPIAPAPADLGDESITNIIAQAEAYLKNNSADSSVFETTMWRAFMIAEDAAASGNWRRSDILLLKLHALAPQNLMLAEKAATIYSMRDAHARAQQIWLGLFSDNPERYELLTQVGKSTLFLGNTAAAIKPLKVAAKLADQRLEPRFYLACAHVKQGEPTRIPEAYGQLTLFEIGTLCYWLGADYERYHELLGETGYLQLASYTLGGGEGGSLEVKDIQEISKQLLTAYRVLNRLDREMGLRRYPNAEGLLAQAFELGVRGLSYELVKIFQQGVHRGQPDVASTAMASLAETYPDRAIVQHFHGMLLMELGKYEAAVAAFTQANALARDPDIRFDLIEAIAATGKPAIAFRQLAAAYDNYPHRVLARLNRDSIGLRAIKQTPEYIAWIEKIPQR